jgi:ABC-type glycerol-3-phosphate transport system permease component
VDRRHVAAEEDRVVVRILEAGQRHHRDVGAGSSDPPRSTAPTTFQVFWRLMVPPSVPVLAAYAIFQFLWVWNDLLVALVVLGGREEVQVVTLNLANLLGSEGQAWQLLTAGAYVTMTVPIIVLFSLQRYFVRGLTAGSVKG